MLPPLGWPGSSNPAGTTTWTRTVPSRAPAAPRQPPPCGRAEPHPPPIPLTGARKWAGILPCRFEQPHPPPLPGGRFEVVFLLETMLAFPDKDALAGEVARVLEPGGRFAFTVEEGRPLTEQERAQMPA